MSSTPLFVLACALSAGLSPALAQQPAATPISPRIAQRLEWFKDQKFGMIIHWGPYSQIGCVESWPVSWGDRKRVNPDIETEAHRL